MKVTEMSQEKREAKRLYDREAKRQSRAKQKHEKERLAIPNAFDYVMPELQQKQLTEHCLGLQRTIAGELGVRELTGQAEYIVHAVASVLFGLENRVTQIVHDPEGMLIGGHFPDGAASEAIEHVHRFPHILQSATFADLYRKFLNAVAQWSKENEEHATPECVQDLNQELAGTYQLPHPLVLSKPEPQKSTEDLPSMPEILERGRNELLRRIHPEGQPPRAHAHDPNIAPAAQRYLDGL